MGADADGVSEQIGDADGRGTGGNAIMDPGERKSGGAGNFY